MCYSANATSLALACSTGVFHTYIRYSLELATTLRGITNITRTLALALSCNLWSGETRKACRDRTGYLFRMNMSQVHNELRKRNRHELSARG